MKLQSTFPPPFSVIPLAGHMPIFCGCGRLLEISPTSLCSVSMLQEPESPPQAHKNDAAKQKTSVRRPVSRIVLVTREAQSHVEFSSLLPGGKETRQSTFFMALCMLSRENRKKWTEHGKERNSEMSLSSTI
eukprot:1158108-Pelagomonas_calceolata.AAC.4